MNNILDRILIDKKPNFDKLKAFGFVESGNKYCYTVKILENQFLLSITVTETDTNTEVIDLSTNEPYSLFLVENATGSFVGKVKAEYEEIISKIAEKCFEKNIFKSKFSKLIIKYVSDTYGDDLEFLWDKFPKNAILRRRDNKKWYAALLTVSKNKLNLASNEEIEILDLRVNSENIDQIVNGKTIFYGYHMNKKHWISVLLDGSIPIKNITKMIDDSYKLAQK